MDGEDREVQKYRWVAPLLVVALIFGLVLIFGREFMVDPSRTAATRDPAWYTWRAGIIVQSNPGLVAGDWGPFHMFGGGYRVAVPVLGALMQGVGGTAQSSFPAFMMVGIPILAGLAFGAGAYRSTKSNLLYMLTMVLTGVFYLTTPYVGYLDNTFVLFVLAALIGFLEPARKSWGARSAVALLAFLAAYTHPTTCVVFLGTLFAVLGFHLLTQRFNFRAVLDRDLPALASVMAGMIFGLVLWPLGKLLLWGTAGSLADAALPPPYTRAFFMDRLMEWVRAEYPLIVIPLIVVAVLWIRRSAHVEKKPADAYRTMTAWWLLPYLASVVFVAAGKVLPYYRFMNSTAAIMPLTAIGIWVLGMWLYKKTDRNKLVAAVSFIVLIAGIGYAFGQGIEASRWNDPTNQWIDQGTRAALVSVATVAEADPAHPVVFVNNYDKVFQAYGWSKTDANVGRAGLPGAVAPRTFQYFGDLAPFLAGERTITNESCNEILSQEEVDLSAITGGKQKDANGDVMKDADGNDIKTPARTDCTYDLVSRGFLDEMKTGVAANGGTPYVFMVRKFNTPSDSSKYFDMSDTELEAAGLVRVGPDLLMVTGSNYSMPDYATLQKAIAAGTAETEYLTNHPKAFSDPAHLLRVLFGLFFLVALPGLLAARWFEVEGWQMKLGLVPPISLGINIVVAIAFISVTRSAFTTAHAWTSVGVATVAAGGLNLAARRRTAASPGPFRRLAAALNAFMAKGGQMIDDMAVPFIEKKSFRALMLTQFISMAGDGIVAGSVIKSISFGGASGFDPTSAKSSKDLLAIVFLTYLPFTLLSPFVGVFIDRFDRRKLLVVSNYVRAVLVAIAGFLLLTGVDATGILVVLALLVLAGFRLMLAIKGAGMADAVDGKDLLVANSLSQAGGTIFQAGGAIFAVAGAIIAPSGGIALMAVACYAFAGLFARGIARLEATPHDTKLSQEMQRLLRDTVAGVKEVASRPAAAIGLVSFQFTRMLAFGFVGLAFVFAAFETVTGKGSKGTSKVELAIGLISAGIGAGIGLVLAQRWKDKIAPAKVAITAMLFAGGAAVLFAPLGGLLGRFLLNFFVGLGFFLVKVSADVMTQRSLPDDFRGRAYALFDIAYALSYAIPALVLWLAANAGISLKFVVAGAGALVVLLALAMGGWAKKRHLYEQVSDDLEGDQIATGVE